MKKELEAFLNEFKSESDKVVYSVSETVNPLESMPFQLMIRVLQDDSTKAIQIHSFEASNLIEATYLVEMMMEEVGVQTRHVAV